MVPATAALTEKSSMLMKNRLMDIFAWNTRIGFNSQRFIYIEYDIVLGITVMLVLIYFVSSFLLMK